MILDEFTRYLRATQLTTVQVSSTIETTFGRIVNKDFKYDMFRIISSHMRVLRLMEKIIGIEIRLSLNTKKKSSKLVILYRKKKKRRFIYTITDPCIVYIQLYCFKFYPGCIR